MSGNKPLRCFRVCAGLLAAARVSGAHSASVFCALGLVSGAILIATRAASEPTQAVAQCHSISDGAKRLACYDKTTERPAPKPTPKIATPKSAQIGPEGAAFASNLERLLLSKGIDNSVFFKDGKITLWMWLSRATVYQLITEGKLLEQAQKAGFNTFDFWDKGGEGHWLYDLPAAGQPPRCDRSKRLCY